MDEEVEDDATMVEGGNILDHDVGLIRHTQHSKIPRPKISILTGTPQSKLIPDLMVDDTKACTRGMPLQFFGIG